MHCRRRRHTTGRNDYHSSRRRQPEGTCGPAQPAHILCDPQRPRVLRLELPNAWERRFCLQCRCDGAADIQPQHFSGASRGGRREGTGQSGQHDVELGLAYHSCREVDYAAGQCQHVAEPRDHVVRPPERLPNGLWWAVRGRCRQLPCRAEAAGVRLPPRKPPSPQPRAALPCLKPHHDGRPQKQDHRRESEPGHVERLVVEQLQPQRAEGAGHDSRRHDRHSCSANPLGAAAAWRPAFAACVPLRLRELLR